MTKNNNPTPRRHREAASEIVGAFWAAMHKFCEEFSQHQPEITHLEVVEADWEDPAPWRKRKPADIIKQVHLCGCFSSEKDDETLKEIYKKFFEWMEPHYKFCKLPQIPDGLVFYMGFNYHKPGLIVYSGAGFNYDENRDLCDITPSTGRLYESVEDREKGNALEDKAWDEFMTAYEEE